MARRAPSDVRPTKLIITGAKGRMGQTLLSCAERSPEVQVIGQIDLGDDLLGLIKETDAVIDFSFHDATGQFASVCAEHRKALVIGTTGHSEAEKSQISNWSAQIPIVWASNYSTGVNTLFWLTRKAAEILGPNFDLEIVEMHLRTKKDAPSGTATTLAEILASVLKQRLSKVLRHGRHGFIGERPAADVRQDDDTLHMQLVDRPLELSECGVGVVHRDRGEAKESPSMFLRELGVRFVRLSRDVGLGLPFDEVHVRGGERQDRKSVV